MTEPIILTALGGVVTALVAFAGYILNSIHGDMKQQREETPRAAEQLRKYTEDSANIVREEAKNREQSLNCSLDRLRESFDKNGDRQEKLWESHHQEHSTFRDIMLNHEGRISGIEGHVRTKANTKIRNKVGQ